MDWWQSRMECEMTHDPTRDCEHGRLKGKCDVCDLQAEVERLTDLLNNPEEHYPGNFNTPQRANALLTGLCQDAANEIERLNAEVLEQCRIIAMSAEREDSLRAELTRLKASIALDKMAESARELGLDYEPAVQEKCFLCGERVASCTSDVCPKSAQPAVIQQMVDALDHADELLGGNDTLVMNGAAAGRWLLEQPAVQEPVFCEYCGGNDDADFGLPTDHCTDCARPQPVPVKTYHDGKPWPVAPKPWVGLSEEEVYEAAHYCVKSGQSVNETIRAIEAKLKEKNHDQ
jgi:signal recognition particle subunit SEC65